MKRTIISEEQIKEIISDYLNLLSSDKISEKYGITKRRVLLILKKNNVETRQSGRLYMGGIKMSTKRYLNKDGVKEKKSINHKNWYSKNKEHVKEYHKTWRENNKDKWRKSKREYEKTRKSKDPVYKLVGNFRTAIYTVLKENNVKKFGHYFDILGYSQENLINHLENQFDDKMSWENYGKWHVDHKLPITFFNFTSIEDEEFKKCWSLDNLQPMWGSENISKSNRINL
jgi:hypothetical protein